MLVVVLTGCASGPPATPLPAAVTGDFFPLELGSWWEYDVYYPGFPDRPQRFRYVLQAPDAQGRYSILARARDVRLNPTRQQLRLWKAAGRLRMLADGQPLDLLVFGARVGDTWPYNPSRPQYLARLAALRYERVLGEWRPVARVTFHAGGPAAPVVKEFWFARGVGWSRIVQRRPGLTAVESVLVAARIYPGRAPGAAGRVAGRDPPGYSSR